MKVILTTGISGPAGAFNAGDEYTCSSAAEAQRMFEAGFAVPVSEAKVERAVKKAPAKETRD